MCPFYVFNSHNLLRKLHANVPFPGNGVGESGARLYIECDYTEKRKEKKEKKKEKKKKKGKKKERKRKKLRKKKKKN